jgi:antitoxin (DNA-binding transcriptional repressor) of toxin-antitoxin stability system
MRKTSVRDLRYHFSRVEHLLREGKEIQITKRNRAIARLIPIRPTVNRLQDRPNFLARLKKIYGEQSFRISGAQRIAEERDRY